MPNQVHEFESVISRYSQGAADLQASIGDLPANQTKVRATPGLWSVLEVVCHVADFELVYADRIKRVIVEDRPTLFSGDPDQFASRLAYGDRDLNEEIECIAAVRRQVTRILRTLDSGAFHREGIHSVDGPLTLAKLLERITGHIPHHAQIIREKRTTLAAKTI